MSHPLSIVLTMTITLSSPRAYSLADAVGPFTDRGEPSTERAPRRTESTEWTQSDTPCKKRMDLFFTQDEDTVEQAARREADAKALCGTCERRDQCLLLALEAEARPGKTFVDRQGIFGGATPEERHWLVANPDVAVSVADAADAAGVSTTALAEWHTQAGPDDLTRHAGMLSADEQAARWGATPQRIATWLRQRHEPTKVVSERDTKKLTATGRLVRVALLTHPDRDADGWLPRSSLTDVVKAQVESMPESTRAELLAKRRKTRDKSVTLRQVADTLLMPVLRDWDSIEKRSVSSATSKRRYVDIRLLPEHRDAVAETVNQPWEEPVTEPSVSVS